MKHFIGNFLLMTVLGGETFMYRINLSPALYLRGHASCCTDSNTQSPETLPGWRRVVQTVTLSLPRHGLGGGWLYVD